MREIPNDFYHYNITNDNGYHYYFSQIKNASDNYYNAILLSFCIDMARARIWARMSSARHSFCL